MGLLGNMDDSDGDDADLEAELLRLEGGDGASAKKGKAKRKYFFSCNNKSSLAGC